MSAPHMSGRTDTPAREEHLDPTDLLDENGRVDQRKIKQITNSGTGDAVHITPADCTAMREALAGADTVAAVEGDFACSRSTIRDHAKGECYHTERCVGHAPLEHDGSEWVVRE